MRARVMLLQLAPWHAMRGRSLIPYGSSGGIGTGTRPNTAVSIEIFMVVALLVSIRRCKRRAATAFAVAARA
jgi:hypothetical protein